MQKAQGPGVCKLPKPPASSAPPPRSVPQAAKLHEQEHKEESLRLQQLEERRRLQEAELRRVEEEKERALGLQRRERELRARLLSLLLSKKADAWTEAGTTPLFAWHTERAHTLWAAIERTSIISSSQESSQSLLFVAEREAR